MKLRPEEPSGAPWRVIRISDFMRLLLEPLAAQDDRPQILAVDGRSGSGKTTVAQVLRQGVRASAVIHTDDVAWHHSFFDWSDLLIEGVLKPLRRGEALSYRPPGWIKKGRPGALTADSGLALIIVEGVGASRGELMPFIDASVWVQSDFDEAERRGILRDGGTAEAVAFWHEWMDAELDFMARERPWEGANAVVNGTPRQSYDPATELVISARS